MQLSDSELKKFLADAGLLSRKAFDDVGREAQETGRSVEDVLLAKSLVGEDELRRTKAYALGIPFVTLLNRHIPFEILLLIPEPIARRNNLVAFAREGDAVEVAMLDTDDMHAIEFLNAKAHLKLLPRLTDLDSMRSALKQYQKGLREHLGEVVRRETTSLREAVSGGGEDDPAARIVDALLRHAGAQRASDIHIEPLEETLRIRYRIDGVLHDAMELPAHASRAIASRLKSLAGMRTDEERTAQDGRFAAQSEGEKLSFRVSSMPTVHGEKIMMRVLRDPIGGFTLESIGFHGDGLESVHGAMRGGSGVVLLAGRQSAELARTLYTLLDSVNTPEKNIATIEDPIRYRMKRVNQTQVRPEIGFSLASGLRALVRQDPDVIMVSELRDRETAQLALHAARTGRLVISAIPADSATNAIAHLLEMGVDPFMLASTLRLVIAQRDLARLSGERTPRELSREEQSHLESIVDPGTILRALKEESVVPRSATWRSVPFYTGTEISGAENTQRLGIHEILSITETLKELIMREIAEEDIRLQAKSEGMLTFGEDGVFKAAQGLVTMEEVLRALDA